MKTEFKEKPNTTNNIVKNNFEKSRSNKLIKTTGNIEKKKVKDFKHSRRDENIFELVNNNTEENYLKNNLKKKSIDDRINHNQYISNKGKFYYIQNIYLKQMNLILLYQDKIKII